LGVGAEMGVEPARAVHFEEAPFMPHSPSSPPPTYFLEGRYLAVDLLACGETSEIFSGTDTWSGELVAIRILRADRPERASTFQRMAERLFGLSSSRVIRAIHLGDDRAGRPFLVTELLVGRGVEALGRVRWEVACEVVRRCARGVGEMHLNGLHHGSLRASTFFIGASAEGGTRVKLLDLGTGERGATADKDRRALAAVLYRLLTGKPPLPTPTNVALPDAPQELSSLLTAWLYEGAAGAPVADMGEALRQLVDPGSGVIPADRESEPIPEHLVFPKSTIRFG
jgi:hypothetical protein